MPADGRPERWGSLALTLGLWLAGCAGARVEERAELRFPPPRSADAGSALAGRPGAPAERAAAASAEPVEWGLAQILASIARANPTLGEAQARLAEARAVEREAAAAYLPELSLGLDYIATDNPSRAFGLLLDQEDLNLGPGFDATPGSTENWRKELRLDWPLFAPGRRESHGAARAGEQAAALAGEALERRLLNAGVQAWLGLRAGRELEQVARESSAVVERRLALTRERHAAGAALRADVLRLEVRLASSRQEAALAALRVRQAESALNRLMGRPPDAALALLAEAVEIGSALPRTLEALLATAEGERRDLLAVAHRLRMSSFQAQASKAGRYPTLQAFAAYDIDGSELAPDTDLDSYVVGFGLRFPFSAGTGARIRQAEARERQARESSKALALSVAQEVRDAWEELEVAGQTLALAEASVGAAEEAFRMLAAAQDAGGATVTDVLEAEDARRQARVRVVAARAGVQLARARLVAATGGVQ